MPPGTPILTLFSLPQSYNLLSITVPFRLYLWFIHSYIHHGPYSRLWPSGPSWARHGRHTRPDPYHEWERKADLRLPHQARRQLQPRWRVLGRPSSDEAHRLCHRVRSQRGSPGVGQYLGNVQEGSFGTFPLLFPKYGRSRRWSWPRRVSLSHAQRDRKTSTHVATVTSSSPSATSHLSSTQCGKLAGTHTKSATKLGSQRWLTWRSSVSSLDRCWWVFSVTGTLGLRSHISWDEADGYQARSEMGSDPRCHHHVHRSRHACLLLGYHSEWLGHMLHVVSLLLRDRCWWWVPHDGNVRHGECRWLWQGLNKGRPSSPRSESHQRFFDARLGPTRQPSHPHCCPAVLPPRKREPTVLGGSRAMDLPCLLCHSSGRYTLAGVLPYFQDEIRRKAIGRSKEEVKGHRLRYSVSQADLHLLRPAPDSDRWRLVLQRHFLLWQQAIPVQFHRRHHQE